MKMPVAHVYGWEPSLPYCASAPIPTGVSEYEVMGAIRGAPVELIKCETSDLMVPANCEMVIEGFIDSDPETFEMEGPFGEYTGYFGGDQGPKHVTKVTAVTYRNDLIHRGTLEGTLPKMLNENSITSSVQRAGVAWNVLERAGVPGVTDVHCPAANNGTTLMIQLNQTYRGQAKQAAAAIWGSNAAHLRYKNVWVLDDDIDIHDYASVDWAFAYRVNAAEDDIVFFPGSFGSLLDPSTRLRDRDPMKFEQANGAAYLSMQPSISISTLKNNTRASATRRRYTLTKKTWTRSIRAGKNTGSRARQNKCRRQCAYRRAAKKDFNNAAASDSRCRRKRPVGDDKWIGQICGGHFPPHRPLHRRHQNKAGGYARTKSPSRTLGRVQE